MKGKDNLCYNGTRSETKTIFCLWVGYRLETDRLYSEVEAVLGEDTVKSLLMAINAKYAHTSLAVRSLNAYACSHGVQDLAYVEYTINQPLEEIFDDLVLKEPQILLISCYIWNIEMVKRLIVSLKRALPQLVLVLGGPEVSYQAHGLLSAYPMVDYIVRGEGEYTVCALLQYLKNGGDLESIDGLSYRRSDTICHQPDGRAVDMADLGFAYDDLAELTHRALYYESQRGCPFACGYCLSSIEKGVRYKPLPLVFAELDRFIEKRVLRVKFVDRTFNSDPERALTIWRYLCAHDNGVTNFHFELAAHLLDQSALAFLQTVRPGLFQFEIGVQSTHQPTLQAVRRQTDFNCLRSAVSQLRNSGHIHLHLDLIAGLPEENFQSFRSSFNDVYDLRPHQFQLGFLKLLKGSYLEQNAARLGLVAHADAPYEIICTQSLSAHELIRLKGIESVLDLYYNSGRFDCTLEAMTAHFDTPFDFYDALALFYRRCGYQGRAHQALAYYTILRAFYLAQGGLFDEAMQWRSKYDILRHDKVRLYPEWLTVDGVRGYRDRFRELCTQSAFRQRYLPEYADLDDVKSLLRQIHLEVFPCCAGTGSPVRALLFNYRRRDPQGKAEVCEIQL